MLIPSFLFFFSQENLKILRQYSKLLSHACHYAPAHPDDQPIPAHAQPLSRCPPDAAYPPHLQWFQHLADRPYRGLDAAADARIHTLLKLHLAVQPSEKQKKSPQQQAYELALSLPHYDRDLTAFYLSTAPPDHEYELEVAHSIMRLHAPPTPPALAHWRQQGLLHVLHVAAVNMPDHAQDWGLPAHQPLRDLLAVLNHPSPQSPAERLEAIQRFVAAHDPSQPASQHVASCLDRLAVLMGVKSNAPTPEKHDLAACLAAFPHLEALQAASTWATIKSALENALPPSLLLLDATCAKRRIKQADGTW